MTDSSKNNDNGNGSSNGGKRPGGPNGTGAPHSKLVKFNGNASHTTGSNNGISNNRKSGNYTAEELLAQRKALPIYPTQEK